MSFVHEQSAISQLHGLLNARSPGDTSSGSRKRDVELTAERSHDQWKNQPTTIIPPANPRLPTTTYNPYSAKRMHNGFKASSKAGNPTAKQTILSQTIVPNFNNGPSQKKRRMEDHMNPHHAIHTFKHSSLHEKPGRDTDAYMTGLTGERKQSPDTSETDDSDMRNSSASSRERSDVQRKSAPVATRSSETINIDTDEDVGIPVTDLSHSKLQSSRNDDASSDPLDLFDSTNSLANGLGVSINANHPFHTQDNKPSCSRSSTRDGPSTQRIRVKLLTLESANSNSNIQSTSVITIDDEDDPIENADTHPVSEINERSIYKRGISPGGETLFRHNNVQQKIDIFEAKPLPPVVDLRKVHKKSGRVVENMKKREPQKKQLGTRALQAVHNSQPASSIRHDSIATAPTPFVSETHIYIPLEAWAINACVYRSDPESHHPTHWLVWNPAIPGLLIRPHPPGTHADRNVCTVPASHLDPGHLKHSNCQSERLIQVKATKFTLKSWSSTSDGLITFKFPSKHANTESNYDRIVDVLKDRIPDSDVLDGHGARSCWEMTLRMEQTAPEPPSSKRAKRLACDTSNQRRFRPAESPYPTTVLELPKSRPRPKPAYKGGLAPSLPSTVVRRSTRLDPKFNRTPSPNPDEIILVYPPNGPGAVNVCNSDLKRLQPGEYLNDTLIELGLKFWMNDLRRDQPELADQIHVFSSFFYKKLNSKNVGDGYQSLRKWTAKFDFFQKKYIIVPINEHIHWYLAIIYHPEHVLQPPLLKPTPRSSNVSTRARGQSHLNSADTSRVSEGSDRDSANIRKLSLLSPTDHVTMSRSSSDEVVEQVIQSTRGCSIEVEDQILGLVEGGGPPATSEVISDSDDLGNLTDIDNEVDELADDDSNEDGGNLTVAEDSKHADRPVRKPNHFPDGHQESHVPMDVDDPLSLNCSTVNGSSDAAEISTDMVFTPDFEDGDKHQHVHYEIAEPSEPSSSVTPLSFYQTREEKFRGSSTPRPLPQDVREIEEDEETDTVQVVADTDSNVPGRPTTYIFTLDSLASRHPQAIRLLKTYLQLEAKDKKGLEINELSEAVGKQAQVLLQPNYCDCGLYLLHFARTFMQDPESYCKTILTTKKATADDRYKTWRGEEVAELRDCMARRVLQEGEAWKTERIRKEEEKKDGLKDETVPDSAATPDESDDEIIMQEISKPPPPPGGRGKKASETKKRVEKPLGDAPRMRG